MSSTQWLDLHDDSTQLTSVSGPQAAARPATQHRQPGHGQQRMSGARSAHLHVGFESFYRLLMMDVLSLLFNLFLYTFVLGICVYAYFSWKFGYFKRKGIPYLPSYPIVGSLGPPLFQKVSGPDYSMYLYQLLKDHKFGGFFHLNKPGYLIRDPEIIKLIVVKNFDHFVDRNVGITDEHDDLFGGSVFALTGKRWRDMRSTLSPAFTSSKMKNMFLLVAQCSRQLTDFIERKRKEGDMLKLEMKDFWTRYTNDAIATAGFGVQCDSLRDPDNDMYQAGKSLTDFSGYQAYSFIAYMINGALMKFLGLPLLRPKASKFLKSLVKETLSIRERDKIVRPDFIHLLMQARRGELTADLEDEDTSYDKHGGKIALTDTEIAAQVTIMYFAGFETTSTLLCFLTNRLAVYPDIQLRLQQEIDSMFEEDGGRITYEGIQRLTYLDMIISETLRLYTPVDAIDRKCTKRFVVAATDTSPELVIEKGEVAFIPVYALHRDPEYFPEPLKFDPERFSDENKHKIKPFTYLPFGLGPRNCIGMRLALMEVKTVIAHLLSLYNLCVVKETPVEIKLSKTSFNFTIDAGFWTGITPRKRSPN